MSLEGQQLGEFEILECLGRGGMGEVYKARQTSLDRFVALKTLHASMAVDAEYITRFRQEARAAAGLSHPNLVQVFSAGESEGLHWFAMEYIEGESARVRLQRKGRLDPQEAIAIAIHVVTALEYGWRKAALIHRDVKPDNIFLSGDGEVKLGDLGLAKSVGQAGDLTTTGASMGTPRYISPEQVEGRKDVDLRSDIYGLGCTLFHLLSGQPPYAGDTAMAVMLKHVSAPVPDLRSVWPECPAELGAAVIKMIQKEPANRQQNYGVVSADLQRAYAVLTGACVPTVVTATGQPEAEQMPIAGQRKTAVPVAVWIGGGVAALAAIAAVLYFGPWQKGGASSGGTRSVVSQASMGEGGKKVGADPFGKLRAGPAAPFTPASGNTVAVATTPQPEATPAPATPAPVAQLPAPSTPVPATPSPSATPRPLTEVEKWFAQVDGPQQEAFQKQVLKPFEAGVADLRARYLASLDAAMAKASTAGQLAEALVWRNERQAFEKAPKVAADDANTPAALKTLRVAYRQQLAKLEEVRMSQARALLASYDAILAKNQTLLTQHQRLDDAQLLKNKRDEIARAWVGASKPAPVVTAEHPESAKSGPPLLASKDAPFKNSLGMEFAPVPITGGPTDGQRVLFSVWDTRVQDYEVFARDTGQVWPTPDFPQGPTNPAVNVSWEDAQLFCQWLTAREQGAGRVPAGWSYRLPSDHEWSCAVGIGARERAEMLPIEKSEKISDAFPWGMQWPPPAGAGNYDPSLQVDKFQYSSPVGSFSANRFGLFDLGGNAWEWCEDLFDEEQGLRVLRGASWYDRARHYMLSSNRYHDAPGRRSSHYGFRCVLAISGGGAPKPAQASAVPQPVPKEAITKQLASATKDSPFINSLEMKFAPVPIIGGPTDGQRVLFSVWKTRVQDYEVFAQETGMGWPKPDFEQGPTHPALMVNWDDANAFCTWLTDKERAAGKIGAQDEYRLPSDHEWSCAAGIGAREHAATLPIEKSGKIAEAFPWGPQWPPPKGAGNYGPSLQVDKFGNTSPVGSFPPNRFGLRDLGGNAWEWCEDWFGPDQKDRVQRGASWYDPGREVLLSSFRSQRTPGARLPTVTFRCVLAISGGNAPKAVQAPSVPQPIAKDATTKQLSSATKESPFVNSLGMKFAPVPITGGPTNGQQVLFSVWKTRVQDYEVFAQEIGRPWTKPDFEQGPTHPAVNVTWDDVHYFCQWLTGREQAAGRLPAGMGYRLPSDHEWSCAVGIGAREHAAMQPAEKHEKINDVYPWGIFWPPPKGAGNYDASFEVDKFQYTSPVGSFSANRFGLFDLGGNAWERCEDLFDKGQKDHVLRGGSWGSRARGDLLSSARHHYVSDGRRNDYGFRCVLASAPPTAPQTATTDWIDALALVDPSKHASSRSVWHRAANELEWVSNEESSAPTYAGTIQLPVTLAPSYVVEVEFTSGAQGGNVGIVIPVGYARHTTCWFVGDKGYAGIGHVDGKDPQETSALGASSPFRTEAGHRYTARAEVRRAPEGVDIQFLVDGKLVGAYRGPTNRLAMSALWFADGDRTHVRLGSNRAVVFHRARIMMLGDLNAPGTPTPTTPAP